MSLTFKPVTELKHNVKIEIPGDFGRVTKADIDVKYKRLPVSEAKALIEKIQDKKIDEATVLQDHVVDIEGIKDAEGKDLAFSPDLLSQLIEEAYIRVPLLQGFLKVNYGLDKLKAKN
ncbi:MAG: hypothetical protein CMK92_05225 [Pseudomonas sp.]|nr:hypothetical protein [Pseudomonas sp.]